MSKMEEGKVRTKYEIEYGAVNHVDKEEIAQFIYSYNEMVMDVEEDRLLSCDEELIEWEFYISDVEYMLSTFDNMSKEELANFKEDNGINNLETILADFKNWLEDGRKAGHNWIYVDWFEC